MYQNMDCVIIGDAFTYMEEIEIYNAADEKIENPQDITTGTVSNRKPYGYMVPYGGYIKFKMSAGHQVDVYYGSMKILNFVQSSSPKIKIVRDLIFIERTFP